MDVDVAYVPSMLDELETPANMSVYLSEEPGKVDILGATAAPDLFAATHHSLSVTTQLIVPSAPSTPGAWQAMSSASPAPSGSSVALVPSPYPASPDFSEDDLDLSDPAWSPASTPAPARRRATSRGTGSSSEYRARHLQTQAKDACWSRELLELSTRALNTYIRSTGMAPAAVTELKQARRRFKNRGYAKKSRDKKRRQTQAQGRPGLDVSETTDDEDFGDEDDEPEYSPENHPSRRRQHQRS